jgi:hypothetical protein
MESSKLLISIVLPFPGGAKTRSVAVGDGDPGVPTIIACLDTVSTGIRGQWSLVWRIGVASAFLAIPLQKFSRF